MSSADTTLKTQRRRHKGPLVGITIALIAAAVFGVYFSGQEGPNTAATLDDVEVAPSAATVAPDTTE